jgi:MFS family permease
MTAPTPALSPPSDPGIGRRSLLALGGVIFLDALSYSLILPLLPFILKSYGVGALVGGSLIATHALFAAFSGPLLGALSDRVGRKWVILGSVTGTAISYVLFGLSHSLATLYVARALAGAMAGNFGVVQAAVADRTTVEARAKSIGLLNAAMAMGFVLGPAISALIGRHGAAGTLLPGLTAAGASTMSLVTVWGFFREGQIAPGRLASRRWLPLRSLTGRSLELLGLTAVAAMAQTGLVSMTGFWASSAFGWGPREVGLLFFWVAAFMVGAQVVAIPRIVRALGERPALILSLALCIAAAIGLILSARSLAGLLVCAPALFCGITMMQTMSTSLLSQEVDAGRRGGLLGLASGVGAIARVCGPALCGLLFARVDPSAPYWLVAATMALWLVLLSLRKPLAGVGANPSA